MINFWAGLKEECPHISSVAVKKLLPFASTYLCETAFSKCAATKTKYRSRVNAEHDMRTKVSDNIRNFKALLGSKLIHPSH
jgi:adenine C2-methylase RlmN of 23S rRNA A2503 and tRNA A37